MVGGDRNHRRQAAGPVRIRGELNDFVKAVSTIHRLKKDPWRILRICALARHRSQGCVWIN